MKLLEHFHELSLHPKNAKELKGLILQLAVQGKLTRKWREENEIRETAEELLVRIKKYNQDLLESKKRKVKFLKKEISVHLDLPETWTQVKNAELFTLQKGKNPKDLSQSKKKYAYLDIEALDRGNVRRYSEDEKAPKCTDSDILVVCDGSRSGLILKGQNGIVGSTLAIIETPPFIQDFVRILFLENFEELNSTMKGAAIPHLDTKKMLQDSIGLPPLPEQKAIVKTVEELFEEVEQLEQLAVKRVKLKEDFAVSALRRLIEEKAEQEWPFVQTHFHSFFNEEINIKNCGKLFCSWPSKANSPASGASPKPFYPRNLN